MVKSLAGTVLVAAAAASLMAAPAAASAESSGLTATTASAQLIRTKVYFGRCRDTCQIRVRIRNVSRTNIFDVRLNARLRINGRNVGTCYDHVGSIRAKRTKWASCTVRSRSLSNAYNRYLDGFADFNQYVNTTVNYRYYR